MPQLTVADYPPHPGCLSAVGVVGNVVYRVWPRGSWELFRKGDPERKQLTGGVEPSFQQAWKKARDTAKARDHQFEEA